MQRRCTLLLLAALAGITYGQSIPPGALEGLDAPGGLIVHIGATRAFENMDTNRDGKATMGEYRELYSDQFDGLDKNRDGVLTPDEM